MGLRPAKGDENWRETAVPPLPAIEFKEAPPYDLLSRPKRRDLRFSQSQSSCQFGNL
jgi:hypothetical protein